MKKLLWPLLFSAVSLTAQAEIPVIHAQYCLGVYVGRDEVMTNIAEMAKSERDPTDRQALEKWVEDHERGKARLSEFVAANQAPEFLQIFAGNWRQEVMAKASHDLADDARSRTACETEKKKCVPSEATKRVAKCNDLSWLN